MQSLYLNMYDMKVKVLVGDGVLKKEVSRGQEKVMEEDKTSRFL